MAYISFQPSDFFKALKYSYASPPNAISGVGFSPNGLVIKSLSGTSGGNNWYAGSTVGGNTESLRWNASNGYETSSDSVTAYDSDGFTLGADSGTGNVNMTGTNYVSYNWKAGTTSGLSGGTITPSAYSINTTNGYGIYTFTGTGSNGTIAHGLGVTPDLVIVKRTDGTAGWIVQHAGMDAATGVLYLQTTHAEQSEAAMFNSTRPTSTVFSLGTASETNGSGNEYIAYVWADIKGYQRMGIYRGNGDVNGTFVHTGFRPAFLMTKKFTGTGNWIAVDSARSPNNENSILQIEANASAAEYDSARCDLLSNGFKCRASGSDANGTGEKYIYIAFAEFPLVSSNSKAGTAR